jgi:hypothetical protein
MCRLKVALPLRFHGAAWQASSMPRARLETEMTFKEAARRLGRERDSEGRGLRRLVLVREKQIGRPIAVRLAGAKRPKLRVTLAALWRAFPEFRETRHDALARELRGYVGQLDVRVRGLVRQFVRDELERSRV